MDVERSRVVIRKMRGAKHVERDLLKHRQPHGHGDVRVRHFFVFFSSRRRHTRYWRDWSSDVCSSDLNSFTATATPAPRSPCGITSIRSGTNSGPFSHVTFQNKIVDKQLRILGIVNLPWDPRLGAARVWFELCEQWTKAGHKIDRFCLSDAFPEPTRSRALSAWRQAVFPYRAARYLRRNAGNFDVIDCLIGTLPFSKKSLRFRNLLVGRSIGLYLPYDEFTRFSRRRWPDQPRGKFVGRFFYTFISWLLRRSADRALPHCDLFNVPNDDEKQSLKKYISAPIIVLPYGLNEAERAALAGATRS